MGRKFHLQTGVTGPANAWSPLHYVPLRLACGNPSIPGRRFIHRANRAPVFSLYSVFVGYNRRWLLPGASQVLPVPVPGAFHTPRKPRTSFFRFLLSSSVRTDVGFCRVLSQVLPVPVPGADSYTAQTAHLLFSLSSVFVGYNRRWLLPGALSGFTCSSTRGQSIQK